MYVNFVARFALNIYYLRRIGGVPEVQIPEEELPVVGRLGFVEKNSTGARHGALRGGYRSHRFCYDRSDESASRLKWVGI